VVPNTTCHLLLEILDSGLLSPVYGHRYVDAQDLQLFKDKIEKEDQPSDVGVWEPMMDKDFGDFTYTAWRRKLPVSTPLG
jgi:hypothetical protein